MHQDVNATLAALQAAAPLTRAEATEEEVARAIAARAERQATARDSRTSGTSRKKYQRTPSGLRYTIAGNRVQSIEDVKAIIPKLVAEYGISRSEAKRIAHKMLHADKSEVAESKRAVKAARKERQRTTGYDAANRIPKMPSGNKDRMKWRERTNLDVPTQAYRVLEEIGADVGTIRVPIPSVVRIKDGYEIAR